MRTTMTALKTSALAAIVAMTLFSPLPLAAHDYKHQGLKLDHPWTRATPPGAKVAGGYVTITNTGTQADRLIGGSFAMSERVEVHEMSVTDGVMRMQQLEKGLEIPPGGTVELKPGGLHLMFLGLTGGPREGERIKGTLSFAKAGDVEVEFAVEPLGASAPVDKSAGQAADGKSNGSHHHHHNH